MDKSILDDQVFSADTFGGIFARREPVFAFAKNADTHFKSKSPDTFKHKGNQNHFADKQRGILQASPIDIGADPNILGGANNANTPAGDLPGAGGQMSIASPNPGGAPSAPAPIAPPAPPAANNPAPVVSTDPVIQMPIIAAPVATPTASVTPTGDTSNTTTTIATSSSANVTVITPYTTPALGSAGGAIYSSGGGGGGTGAVTTTTTSATPWLLYLGIAAAAVGVGYFVFKKK